MKIRIAAIAAFLTFGGGMVLAQTAPMHLPGDAGQSNGSFHRRFDDAEKWAKVFDDPARDEWQKPDEVVDALGLKPDSIVADLGAGTGYFAVRIAKRVPQGKVYAADVEPDMVRYLGERAAREHLSNIVPVQGSADAANLPGPADLILVVDTYHHIGGRTQYFAKLQASLRPGGRLSSSTSSRICRLVRRRNTAFRRKRSRKNSVRLDTCLPVRTRSFRGNTSLCSRKAHRNRSPKHVRWIPLAAHNPD